MCISCYLLAGLRLLEEMNQACICLMFRNAIMRILILITNSCILIGVAGVKSALAKLFAMTWPIIGLLTRMPADCAINNKMVQQ